MAPSTASAAPIEFAIATGMPENHAFNVGAREFQRVVQERTNGGIVVEMFVGGQLGGDMVMLQAVQDGTLAMTWTATPSLASFVPELAVFDIPFFFPTIEDAQRAVANEEFVAVLEAKFLEADFKLGGLPTPGYRVLSANKPIRTLEDLRGIKLRTMENPFHVNFWSALGVTPTPLSSTERFAALQQGTVDGQENVVENAFATRMHEVQSHFIHSRHIAYVSAITLSAKFYDELPDEYKRIIDEELPKLADHFQRIAMENEVDMLKEMVATRNVDIYELPAEEMERWREVTAGTEQLIRDDIGDEIVDLLHRAVGR